MSEKVQNTLLNSSGGNFDNYLDKKFSGTILYYTILTNILVNRIVKFPTTTVPKGILNFSSMFARIPYLASDMKSVTSITCMSILHLHIACMVPFGGL